jgi:hypothetical protein
MKPSEHWASVEADLRRAKSTLPEASDRDPALVQFGEFLQHNELELACEMLETYGDEHPVSKEFWDALRSAAMRMGLTEKAKRYQERLDVR